MIITTQENMGGQLACGECGRLAWYVELNGVWQKRCHHYDALLVKPWLLPKKPTDIILHPTEAGMYPLQTLGQLHDMYRMGLAFADGYMAAMAKLGGYEYTFYDLMRDYLAMNSFDAPYEWYCQVALFLCPSADRLVWIEEDMVYHGEFKPIL